ncbi:MAG: multifunctional transcriptional regulator/nicotinamide-nucleotide adenylyltransferase/ribosylnicotinamide kinase NadR [Erysipelotrichaceae bacterium]
MKNGILFGRYLPLHRGHMFHILTAATLCDKLFVFVMEDYQRDKQICEDNHIDYIEGKLRWRWLCEQLQDMSHIKIQLIECPHNNYQLIEQKVLETVQDVDVMFVKKEADLDRYQAIFKQAVHYVLPNRSLRFPLTSKDILLKPLTNWNYIVGSSRTHFVKKILITGTESCGKTTLIKSLGKFYNTSWCEEVGRFYNRDYMGGNENVYTDYDFSRMSWLQKEAELEVYRSANKIAFVDTDAVVNQYYSQLYLGHDNDIIESIISLQKYDLIIMLSPDTKWVDDGQRLNGDQNKREMLHEHLKKMYIDRGFSIVEICGNYNERLNKAISIVDELLEKW